MICSDQIDGLFTKIRTPNIKTHSNGCASFVQWCLGQNGIKGAGAAGKSYLNWGVKLDKPKYGAIAIFTTGHVGFYMATMKTGNYLILHGNWSDKVSKSDNIKPSEIKQFVFPKL